MEFKGTRGTWQIDFDNPKEVRAINEDGEPLIVNCSLFENYKSGFHLEMTKARIQDKTKYREMQKTITRFDQEDFANAKLIAASKDLLEALKGLMSMLESDYSSMHISQQEKYLKAELALDKALK